MFRTATFDTNVLPASSLEARAEALGIVVHVVSVTRRELEGTSFALEAASLPEVVETLVLGESRLGQAKTAADGDVLLERALRIVSAGSFPKRGRRGMLSVGERNQLRDAMILTEHVRAQHDVFVTSDARAFINHGKREVIEREFSTRVLLPVEFAAWLDAAIARDAV